LTALQKAQALAQKEAEFRDLILKAYKARPFGGSEGGQPQDCFFQGARNGRLVVIGPINLPVGHLFEQAAAKAAVRYRAPGTLKASPQAHQDHAAVAGAYLERSSSL
jgi:hypothetical protein